MEPGFLRTRILRDMAGAQMSPDEVLELHRDAIVVDAHNDWILLLARERAAGNRDGLTRRFIPQLRDGGVDVQVTPVYIDTPFIPEAALRRTLLLIEHLREEAAQAPADVTICLTGADIDEAVGAGKVALVLALEGSHAIGADVELFGLMFELGVRMASFSWMGSTLLAGGSGDGDPGSGLSPKGLEALKLLERLGIIMDVSHLSVASVDDVLEHATRPLVASHSSSRAVRDHHRNLSDEHLKGIAALGGVVGVTAIPSFTHETDRSIERVVDHIAHVAETAGIDHVGVGSDFIKEYVDEEYAGYPDVTIGGEDVRATIEDWSTPEDMPNLTTALVARGFDRADIHKILGGNFQRVFRAVMGTPGSD